MTAPQPFTFRDAFGCDFGQPNVLGSLSREVQANDFWYNRVVAMGADYESRLAESCRYLPLPAAFEQIGIACRAAIRPMRKAKTDPGIWLARLYGIAVLKNLTQGESEFKQQLDSMLIYECNATWHIPLTTWEGLVIDYNATGYRELRSIKATDIKWIVEAWGEPANHATIRSQNPQIWKAAVGLLLESERGGFKGTWDEWVSHRQQVRRTFDAMSCVSGNDFVPPKITPAQTICAESSPTRSVPPPLQYHAARATINYWPTISVKWKILVVVAAIILLGMYSSQ